MSKDPVDIEVSFSDEDVKDILDALNEAVKELSAVGIHKGPEQSDPGPDKYNTRRENEKRELMQQCAFYAESGPTFDPEGKYLCGTCYYRQLMDWGDTPHCYIVDGHISMEAGSCNLYRHGNPDSEWNPLPTHHRFSKEQAGYAESPRKGFGCFPRCEYAAQAEGQDTDGREFWCKNWGVHVRAKACCAFEEHEGIKTKFVQIEGYGTSEGALKGWEYRYHGTLRKNLPSIAQKGLHPSEGQYGKGVYFAPSEEQTKGYNVNPEVMLRVRRERLPEDYEEFPEQGWTGKNVPASAIEMKHADGSWRPLAGQRFSRAGFPMKAEALEAGGEGSGCNPEVAKEHGTTCGPKAGPQEEEQTHLEDTGWEPKHADHEYYLKEQIGGPQGSNPGGMYKGQDGNYRYVKFYSDGKQARGEYLANRVYQSLGINAPSSSLFEKDGKSVIANLQLEGKTAQQMGALSPEQAKQFMNGFAADVLTANWDAVGTGKDNVFVSKSGDVYRLDQGGTFLKRAQGGDKPDSVLNQITELKNFLSPAVNKHYADVASLAGVKTHTDLGSKTGTTSFEDQVKNILALREKYGSWDKFIDTKVPEMPVAEKQKIASMMEARTNLLQTEWLKATGQQQTADQPPADTGKKYKPREWGDPSPKLVGGYFRQGTVLAGVYTRLSQTPGQWQSISGIKSDLEKQLGKSLYNISQNTLKQGGKKTGMWSLEVSGDSVRIFLTPKGEKPKVIDVADDKQAFAAQFAKQMYQKMPSMSSYDSNNQAKTFTNYFQAMGVPLASQKSLEHAVESWTGDNNSPSAQNWRQVAMEYYGRKPDGEYVSMYTKVIGTPKGDEETSKMKPAAMAMKAYASEYAKLNNVTVVYRNIGGEQAKQIVKLMREAEAQGKTKIPIANNSLSCWSDRPDLKISDGVKIRMKVDSDNIWAAHDASPYLFTGHPGEHEWMVGAHNPAEIFDFKDISINSMYSAGATQDEYNKWHKTFSKSDKMAAASDKQTPGISLDPRADQDWYKHIYLNRKPLLPNSDDVYWEGGVVGPLDDHWMYRKDEETK